MNSVQPAKVKGYWEKVAKDFDTIYSGEKSSFNRWLDRVFRKDMYDRLRLTLEECSDDNVQSVLDVGTGSGRFCVPLAKQKEKIVGIDFSAPMIELAKRHSRESGVEDRCDFHVGDFMEIDFDSTFDAILAIGVFDYVNNQVPFLKKMGQLADRKIVTTWPVLWSWRVLPRWVRLNLSGCPVYFYTANKVRKLHEEAGLKVSRVQRVGKIYFVVANP